LAGSTLYVSVFVTGLNPATASLYVVTVAVMGIVPHDTLVNSASPFADAASIMFGGGWDKVVAAVAIVSTLGALNGWILLQGRVPLAFPGLAGLEWIGGHGHNTDIHRTDLRRIADRTVDDDAGQAPLRGDGGHHIAQQGATGGTAAVDHEHRAARYGPQRLFYKNESSNTRTVAMGPENWRIRP
jgi:hypothetical protein